ELDSHVNPNPSYLELFHRLADLALKKLDPKQKKPGLAPPAESVPVKSVPVRAAPAATVSAQAETRPLPVVTKVRQPSVESESSIHNAPSSAKRYFVPRQRYVPAFIRRSVWKRDGGTCTFVGPDGRKCGIRFQLQYDHIVPIAHGGQSTAGNLRLRCRTHNIQSAIQVLGKRTMEKYVGG
ncbi:MAG: HNH endonuclease, partial [Oligoflexia bacterium]|nr:HNH endonuclease [Oligoflexia bacterium]